MLTEKGMKYEEIPTIILLTITEKATVPQIFIGGKHIGGSAVSLTFFNLSCHKL